MEQNSTVHPDYQKGFNEGYSIAKLAPEIAETLSKAQTQSERMKGFKDGRKEFLLEKEKAKDLMPGWLKDDTPTKSDKSKGKDKMDIDKE
jgi:hypothetical protein